MSREEAPLIEALARLCGNLGVRCLVQVGAEDGWEAARIREATGCRAIAIDADPTCKPCDDTIEWHNAFIGADDCMAPFFVHRTSGLSSPFSRQDGQEEKVELRQNRLDTFCRYHLIKPDALIVDTEGSTMDVLVGAGNLLLRIKLVYAEVQTAVIREGIRLLPEVEAFLSAWGLKRREGSPAYTGGAQGNYCFVREAR